MHEARDSLAVLGCASAMMIDSKGQVEGVVASSSASEVVRLVRLLAPPVRDKAPFVLFSTAHFGATWDAPLSTAIAALERRWEVSGSPSPPSRGSLYCLSFHPSHRLCTPVRMHLPCRTIPQASRSRGRSRLPAPRHRPRAGHPSPVHPRLVTFHMPRRGRDSINRTVSSRSSGSEVQIARFLSFCTSV